MACRNKNRIIGCEELTASFCFIKHAYCYGKGDEMVFLLLYNRRVIKNWSKLSSFPVQLWIPRTIIMHIFMVSTLKTPPHRFLNNMLYGSKAAALLLAVEINLF